MAGVCIQVEAANVWNGYVQGHMHPRVKGEAMNQTKRTVPVKIELLMALITFLDNLPGISLETIAESNKLRSEIVKALN